MRDSGRRGGRAFCALSGRPVNGRRVRHVRERGRGGQVAAQASRIDGHPLHRALPQHVRRSAAGAQAQPGSQVLSE